MNTEQVRQLLKKACDAAGSQRQWALAHGLSAPYVNDVIKGNRSPGESIIKALGLRKEERYLPTRGDAA